MAEIWAILAIIIETAVAPRPISARALARRDGWAALTALESDPATAEIPVIMLTVLDEKQIGFALGAADYFTKPIDWGRLSSVLQKYRKRANHQSVLMSELRARTRGV